MLEVVTQTLTPKTARKKGVHGVHGVHQNQQRKPEPPRVVVELPPAIKRDFKRTAQLRGRTITELMHRAIRDMIRAAQAEHPHLFNQLSERDELVIEAIEEGHYRVREIVTYTRQSQELVESLLESLLERGLIICTGAKKTDAARGACEKLFRLKERK